MTRPLGKTIGERAARHADRLLRLEYPHQWQAAYNERRDQLRDELGWTDTRAEKVSALHAQAVEDRRDVVLLVLRMAGTAVTCSFVTDMTGLPRETVKVYLRKLEADGAVQCVGRADDQGQSKLWEVAP